MLKGKRALTYYRANIGGAKNELLFHENQKRTEKPQESAFKILSYHKSTLFPLKAVVKT